MSLIQSAISRYQEAIYQVAVSVSQFERETLHIPLACCFFTPTAGPDEQFDQGFMFVITPVWAFVIMPLLDWTFGNWPSLFGDRAPWRYVGTYLLLISTFWAVRCIVPDDGLMCAAGVIAVAVVVARAA